LATAFVTQHCGPDEARAADVALAVTEAASNVVRHAYPAPATGVIEFAAWVEGVELFVEVADSGIGFDAGSAKPGLGLRLIRGVASLSLRRNAEGGTRLRMTFPCST
jgi:anti-sigma regulatory factor (Ser/Thr protein kinase)